MFPRLFPLLLLLSVVPLGAQSVQTRPESEMRAPFGLHWGDSPQRLKGLLAGAHATVKGQGTHQGRLRWEVIGLKQENLRRTFFYFEQGGLTEVELEYQNPKWKEQDYNAFLGKLRTMINQRFGPGELLERSRSPFDDVMQTIVGYRWKKGDNVMELIYFGAERGEEVYRSVSLHYRVVY